MATEDPRSADDQAIAVVGMAGRFPGAADVASFWQNLCAGREGVRFFAEHELDAAVPASLRQDPAYVRAKGVVDDCDKFDAAFFGVTPLEAQVMDPQHRLLLELAWAALEDAGHRPSAFPGNIGVFVGSNWNRYRMQWIAARPEIPERFGELNTALANEQDFAATRISYKLNLRGPSCTVSTACSTSLVAIAQAAQSLRRRECDMALAGAAAISVPVNAGYLHVEGGMLSRDGHCRPFDADSDGTTFNDGAALVVLRRLSDALADGDHVIAVVRGCAVNNDGADKVSFTAPSVAGQTAVVRAALRDAGVSPETIGFVETHGTATPLGDPIEVAALKRAMAGSGRRDAPCLLGSVKSSIGHLIHAAGVAGFINACLAVRHGRVPPTLFHRTVNPRLALDPSLFRICDQLTEWREQDRPRRAGVSAFGVGGTNAHVVVEQPPAPTARACADGPWIVCLSAKNEAALQRRIAAMAEFLGRAQDVPAIDSVAFTLQVGREPMEHRAAWVVDSTAMAVAALRAPSRGRHGRARLGTSAVLVFAGGNGWRPGCGRGLHQGDEVFRTTYDDGLEVLAAAGVDLRASPWAVADDDPRIALPASFLCQLALARSLEARGLVAETVVGQGIGEIVAGTVAGVFAMEDAVRLVAKVAAVLHGAPAAPQLTAFGAEAVVREHLEPGVGIVAHLSADAVLLAGPAGALAATAARLRAAAIRCLDGDDRDASRLLATTRIASQVAALVRELQLAPPDRDIVSAATGRTVSADEAADPEDWARRICAPARFAEWFATLADGGDQVLIEAGPGVAVTALALAHPAADHLMPIAAMPEGGRGDGSLPSLLATLAHAWVHGVPIDFAASWSAAQPGRCSLPTYPFERVRHWIDHAPSPGVPPAPEPGGQLPAPIPPPPSPAMSSQDRRPSLVPRIVQVLESASGLDLSAARPDEHFAELGFDSLLITQVALAIRKEFGTSLTFRDLMEKYTTIGDLAEQLAKVLPPEPVPSSAVARPQPPLPALPALALPGAPAAGAAGFGVRELIESQLLLMQQQLQVLSAASGASLGAAVAASAAAPAAPPAPPANPAANPTGATGAAPEGAAPQPTTARASPGARIERKRNTSLQLTAAQQAHLNKLLASYAERTGRSKAFAQEHRKCLADPRTVTGFNPIWKEVVYPIVTRRSRGSRLWDLDGNEYIDLTNGFGCIFFGHSPDFVTDAVRQQLERGIEIGPQSPLAGDVARLFTELTGNERLAFATSGSEAVTAALRLARTVTGRDKVVIFEGAYHGIFDEVVVRPGPKGAALPASPGIPRSHVADVVVLPYGVDSSLAQIEALGNEVAAVMVEPVQSRRPELQPADFLRKLRGLTERNGSALIFDEVVTGFRTHPGGMQAVFGIRADIALYGKVAAGGYPIGLIGGKARFLDALDGGQWQFGDDSVPEVGVTFFAGTFVRHPVALAAAKAVLERLREAGPALQEGLAQRTTAMVRDLKQLFAELGLRIKIESFASFFFLSVAPEESWGSLLFTLLRFHGLHIWEHFPCFLTASHTDEDVATIKAVFERAVVELLENGFLTGDRAALSRRLGSSRLQPPVPDAKLGKGPDGTLAWFVPDPARPGKFLQLEPKAR